MVVKTLIAVNEKGLRVGQYHQRAKLTDKEVEQIRWLYEHEGYRYGQLAEMFDIPKETVGRICRYERRNQPVARFREVECG